MSGFIEVHSATTAEMRWTINVAQIVMVRRKDAQDSAAIVLSGGGSIDPAEKYEAIREAILAVGGKVMV